MSSLVMRKKLTPPRSVQIVCILLSTMQPSGSRAGQFEDVSLPRGGGGHSYKASTEPPDRVAGGASGDARSPLMAGIHHHAGVLLQTAYGHHLASTASPPKAGYRQVVQDPMEQPPSLVQTANAIGGRATHMGSALQSKPIAAGLGEENDDLNQETQLKGDDNISETASQPAGRQAPSARAMKTECPTWCLSCSANCGTPCDGCPKHPNYPNR